MCTVCSGVLASDLCAMAVQCWNWEESTLIFVVCEDGSKTHLTWCVSSLKRSMPLQCLSKSTTTNALVWRNTWGSWTMSLSERSLVFILFFGVSSNSLVIKRIKLRIYTYENPFFFLGGGGVHENKLLFLLYPTGLFAVEILAHHRVVMAQYNNKVFIACVFHSMTIFGKTVRRSRTLCLLLSPLLSLLFPQGK